MDAVLGVSAGVGEADGAGLDWALAVAGFAASTGLACAPARSREQSIASENRNAKIGLFILDLAAIGATLSPEHTYPNPDSVIFSQAALSSPLPVAG